VCGIIGYVGNRRSQEILLAGLERLEYRGYDSAGLAWREDGKLECVRAVGNLESLGAALTAHSISHDAPVATTADGCAAGIGHTRWATHGGVSEQNAHPHADATGRIQMVLNGIIENHLELRGRLAADGIECRSDTDAEVVAQLIGLYNDGDLADAVRRSLEELSGHYAFVAMSEDEPETLVGVHRLVDRRLPRAHARGSGAARRRDRRAAPERGDGLRPQRPAAPSGLDRGRLGRRPLREGRL
jgi:glucosamine--fructose-6-phosphate aminotransferase (isomerizing)